MSELITINNRADNVRIAQKESRTFKKKRSCHIKRSRLRLLRAAVKFKLRLVVIQTRDDGGHVLQLFDKIYTQRCGALILMCVCIKRRWRRENGAVR